MRIQTILNRVEKFKSFVYGRPAWRSTTTARAGRPDGPRKNSRVFCSGCGRPGRRVRPLEGTAVRVRAVVGDLGLPGLPDAAGELQAVRGDRRDGAVVRRQESTDHDLPLVPGDLGQAAELERGRLDLPDVVGQRLPGGGARGRVGPGAPGPERGDGVGRGRDRLGSGAHVFDAGV